MFLQHSVQWFSCTGGFHCSCTERGIGGGREGGGGWMDGQLRIIVAEWTRLQTAHLFKVHV